MIKLEKIINFFYTTIIVMCIFFISTNTISAHNTGGSIEKEVGSYFIDIGYDPKEIEVGIPEKIDFELFNKVSKAEIPFSDVWVRIIKGEDTIFASGIHNSKFGKTGILYSFPESGTYNISARFENNDETITELTFPLKVNESSEKDGKPLFPETFMWGIIGIFVGIILSRVVNKYKNG